MADINTNEAQRRDHDRASVLAAIETADAEITASLSKLSNVLELTGAQSALADELAVLQGELQAHRLSLASASPFAARDIAASVAAIVSAAQAVTTGLGSEQNRQNGNALAELSTAQLELIQEEHDRARADYLSFEQATLSRIETLAERNGVDLSTFHRRQEEVDRLREAALASGDRVELYRADVFGAANLVDGLTEAGGSEEEIAQAEAELEAARARYLREREIAAIEQARAQGLSGAELVAFVAADRSDANETLEANISAFLHDRPLGPGAQRPDIGAEVTRVSMLLDELGDFGPVSEAEVEAQPLNLPPSVSAEIEAMDLAAITLSDENTQTDLIKHSTRAQHEGTARGR